MTLRKKDANEVIALLEYRKNGIQFVYADGYKRCCYHILADIIIDCEEQVSIISIKANMQCSICYISQQKRVNNSVVGATNLLVNSKLA